MSDVVVVQSTNTATVAATTTNSAATTDDLTQTVADARYVPLTQRAAANGVATLDGSATVPDVQIPAAIARDAEVTSAVATHAASSTAHIGTYEYKVTVNLGDPQYGADPTGVALSDSALTAVRTAAGTNGIVIVPAGTFLNSGLNLSTPGQEWVLETGATLKLTNGANVNAINISGAGVYLHGPGTVDCNGANQSAGGGIVVQAAANVRVEELTSLNSFGYGVYGRGSDQVRIRRVTVLNSKNVGIFVEPISANITTPVIENCTVDRTGIAAASIVEGGIKVHGSASYTVLKPRIRFNDVFLPVSPTDTSSICIETGVVGACSKGNVVGNNTEGGYMGISVAISDGTRVTANDVYNASTYGIEFPSSSNCTCTGNTIDGNGLTQRGIITDGITASNRLACSANTVTNWTQYGIYLGTGTGHSTVGNTAYTTVVGATAALLIAGGDGSTTTGNNLDGGSQALRGIILDNSNFQEVVGNNLRNFTGSGIHISRNTASGADEIHLVGNRVTGVPAGNNLTWGLTGGAFVGVNVVTFGLSESMGKVQSTSATSRVIWSNGAPAAGAGVSSLYGQQDGAIGNQLWVKESGTGTTVWSPVAIMRTKAGVPVDGDFASAPVNGTMVVDTTDNRIYVRIGGIWKGVEVS